jgi:hypothetical protein
MIDWDLFERTLFRLTEVDLREFAKKHARETFYGFAFDCNSEYGEVGLCANTNELLKVQRARPDPNAAFWASLENKLGRGVTSAANPRKSRWDLGDWDYQGFNSKAFDREWRHFQTAVTERCMVEEKDERTFMTPTQSRFMKAACRVLIGLERGGAFDVLKRTANFATRAMDHDESESEARARMRRIRQGAGGA